MNPDDLGSPHGEIVAGTRFYSLIEVGVICGIKTDRLIAFVAQGIVPIDCSDPETWRFSESALLRLKKATRLHRDLGIEDAGLALALDLLDEITKLRRQIERLQH